MAIPRATIRRQGQTETFLFFWTGVFMYIGKAVDTSIHAHHAIQIAISFDEPIEINLPDASFKLKAAIIDSDQPHECRTYNNTFLLINVAPESQIGIALKKNYLADQRLAKIAEEKSSAFTNEIETELKGDPDSNKIFSITRQFLHSLAGIQETRVLDERISEVLKLLNRPTNDSVKIDELASKVFISPSRLIHLFTTQVGIPIRKYILWTKLLMSLQKLADTKNSTDAALEGGFTDAPHFNRTFKRMFGVNPTKLLKNSQNVQAQRE